MRLFDTHCHFETPVAAEIAPVLERARAAGVEALMAVGGSPALNSAAMAAAAAAKRGNAHMPAVLCAAGFDREQAGVVDPGGIPSAFDSLFSAPGFKAAAVGEIGLDYHYSPETRREQTALFAAQLEEARRRDLPVVVHTREAAGDTAGILGDVPSRGIIHCFTGSPAEAKSYLDLGFHISFSGIVTFRAADNVRAAAKAVPPDRMLIETDSPFLAPVPMRGKVNEPAFVRHTCVFLAELLGRPAEEFAELTFANAERVLGQ